MHKLIQRGFNIYNARFPKKGKNIITGYLRENMFALLRQLNEKSPLSVVYDIGANKGDISLELRQKALPNARYILFEGNEAHRPDIERTGFQAFFGLLSSTERDIEFYSTSVANADPGGCGASYYLEKTTAYAGARPVILRSSRLDDVIAKNDLPLPDLISIDTQGSELDILQGGEKALNHASVVVIEIPVVNYNEGAPNISDYMTFMKKNNFLPIDISETHRLDNILIQIDIIFVRDSVYNNFLCATHSRSMLE